MNKDILRILDANANRFREGLRVVEDAARFMLEKPREAALAKLLRHKVTAGIKGLGSQGEKYLAVRDAEADSGRPSWGPSERRRRDAGEVLSCNLHRAQEAARVLEEFAKIVRPRAARVFKEARYGVYTLEKRLAAGRQAVPRSSRRKMPCP